MARTPASLRFSAIMATILTTLPVGFNLGQLNVPWSLVLAWTRSAFKEEHGYDLTQRQLDWMCSFIVSSQAFGAVLGTFLSCPLANSFGRKFTLMVLNNLILLIAGLVSVIARQLDVFELVILARLIIGVYSGLGMCLLPIFITEISPPSSTIGRKLLAFKFPGICTGMMLGTILSLPEMLGTDKSWRYLMILSLTVGISQLILSPIYHESPWFLLHKLSNQQKAIEAIRFYYGLEANIFEMIRMFEQNVQETPTANGVMATLRDPAVRKGIALAVLLNIAQATTGLLGILSYSTFTFMEVGLTEPQAQKTTIIWALILTILSLCTSLWLPKLARRKVLIGGLTGLAICLGTMFIFSLYYGHNTDALYICRWGFVIATLGLAVFVTIAPGPLTDTITVELVPQLCAVNSAITLGNASFWLSGAIFVFIFYPVEYRFLVFLLLAVICLIVFAKLLPETKTADPEEPVVAYIRDQRGEQQINFGQPGPSTSTRYGTISTT